MLLFSVGARTERKPAKRRVEGQKKAYVMFLLDIVALHVSVESTAAFLVTIVDTDRDATLAYDHSTTLDREDGDRCRFPALAVLYVDSGK
jgi:hypothetical protein